MKRLTLYGSILLCLISAADIMSTYTWQSIPCPYTSDIRSFAINPDGHIFIGLTGDTNANYMYRTEDNGATWVLSTWDYVDLFPLKNFAPFNYYPDIKQVLIAQTGIVYAVAEGYREGMGTINYSVYNGVFRSKDNGSTWEYIYYDHLGSQFNASLNSNGVIYVAPYEDIYCSFDEGDTWICCGPGSSYIIRHEVNNTGQILADNYFYSTDGWKTTPTLPCTECYGINQYGLYYGCNGVHYSEGLDINSGDTWVSIGLTNKSVYDLFMCATGAIYAATDDGLWYTDDNGTTWSQLGLAGLNIRGINMVNPQQIIVKTNQNALYLGTPDAAPAAINITYPNAAGISIERLSKCYITWNSVGNVGADVKIELYLGNNLIKTISDNTPNDGFFNWFVNRCHLQFSGYHIKITSLSQPDKYYTGDSFSIVKSTTIADPKIYQAIKATGTGIPVVDGDLNDPVWSYATVAHMDVGDNPGDYNIPWTTTSDNEVIWGAVWSDITNKVYVAIAVRDDIRGTFDNGLGSMDYSPSNDESIEIFTDSDYDCRDYWGSCAEAQYWRVTEENHRNLLHYPSYGDHTYTGTDFITAVQQGTNGDWGCEIELTIYDTYPSSVKTLSLGDLIGWDVWYNDSDDETLNGTYQTDHQVGWNYQGPVWKQTDYMGYLQLAEIQLPLAVEDKTAVPDQYGVLQNYPNPFNPSTTLSYKLPRQTPVKLQIYNLQGKLIKTLVSDVQPAGSYSVIWNGTDSHGNQVSSGIYFCQLKTDRHILQRKLMLMK